MTLTSYDIFSDQMTGHYSMRKIILSLISFCSFLLPEFSAMADDFLIIGATRNTGLEIAKILVDRGDTVTAFVRPTSTLENLEPLGVEYFFGDAVIAEDVAQAVASKNFDAVLSTLGGGRGEQPPDLVGTINIVDAMESVGLKRLIVVTVIGPGESISMVPDKQRLSLGKIIKVKEKAENYIIASSLDYTIIRPGQLTSHSRSGIIRLSERPEKTGPVTRADLADVVVSTYDNADASKKIYMVVGDDPKATQRMGSSR